TSTRVDGTSFKGSVEGLGYLALAIMIVGKWKILPAVLTSFLFALLLGLSYSFYLFVPNEYSSYSYLFLAVPYLGTLITMTIFGKKSVAPKAVGIPYDKSLR
ncbi:MAG: ABC transporter permease, partial [Metamycoplasmataceae bacterium]